MITPKREQDPAHALPIFIGKTVPRRKQRQADLLEGNMSEAPAAAGESSTRNELFASQNENKRKTIQLPSAMLHYINF